MKLMNSDQIPSQLTSQKSRIQKKKLPIDNEQQRRANYKSDYLWGFFKGLGRLVILIDRRKIHKIKEKLDLKDHRTYLMVR